MKLSLIFTLIATITLASSAYSMPKDVKAHFSVNGTNSLMINPGVPSTIEVYFTDPRSEEEFVYKDFKKMHGKIMHMVLIKKDLSVFKHIHPYFDPVTGRFMITVNMPLSDPDNFHTAQALIEPGMYMVMADVEIKGVGMRMGHTMLHVHGSAPMKPLVMDEIVNNSVQSRFKANGKEYKIQMEQDISYGCSNKLVEFKVTLLMKDEHGKFNKVKNLEPWLTQGAHSVWVSQNFMHKHGMHFAHMHSDLPEGEESSLYFNFHDKNLMKPGIQKIWIQIKHLGRVLTIPLVFEYFPQNTTNNC